MRNELVQLGIDIYENKISNFSKEDANETLRQELLKICGTDKIDYKAFRRHKTEIFDVIEEVLDVLVPQILDTQFDRFVETKNVGWGDQLVFTVPDRKLFKVATISYGNGNLERQRVDEYGQITMTTKMRGIKTYAPVYRFLAGKVDWTNVINKVAESFARELKKEIYEAFVGSFSTLSSTYGKSGTFDMVKFNEIAAHIEAETGMNVVCYGTKQALAKVTGAVTNLSDRYKEKINEDLYLGTVNGVDLIELKQFHDNGTDNFAIDNNLLIFVPVGEEKIVKLGFEGDTLVSETEEGRNADMSKEYLMEKAYGLAIIPSTVYGMYQMS